MDLGPAMGRQLDHRRVLRQLEQTPVLRHFKHPTSPLDDTTKATHASTSGRLVQSAAHGWVPARHPRYTRAFHREEAVGSLTRVEFQQEVDYHAKCFGATSIRSSSPKRAEVLLEVQCSGHRRIWETSSKTLLQLRKKKKRQVKNKAIPVAPTVTPKDEIARNGHQQFHAQEAHNVHASTMI